MYIVMLKKYLTLLFIFVINAHCVFAESASADMSFNIQEYVKIEPVTSPVLTANITDNTGNLYSPLSVRFKVITNSTEKKTLYLKSNTVTDGGFEESMFEMGGQIYIAFANIAKIPKSQSLTNCKLGGFPKDSPGIVAYPVTSITGAGSKFLKGKNKYEVYAENGTTFVTVHVGSNVLPSSFASNDPKGFYQAVLSLTEADI